MRYIVWLVIIVALTLTGTYLAYDATTQLPSLTNPGYLTRHQLTTTQLDFQLWKYQMLLGLGLVILALHCALVSTLALLINRERQIARTRQLRWQI